ncbi:MAG TPA: magnesium-translocating P-type ATPase, partial [Herpetosiphonaceae bacterium]
RSPPAAQLPSGSTDGYWSQPREQVVASLNTTVDGLTAAAARQRLEHWGPNTLDTRPQASALRLLLNQFRSPLVLILVFATIISLVVAEWIDATVILVIVVASALLSFWQEYRATNAIEQLRARVTIQTTVLRDGTPQTIPTTAIVPGDVVLLSAGSLVPADGLILNAKDCYVNEATLTGESLPIEKAPGIVATEASLPERTNCLFLGTSLRSGTARLLIVQTGTHTLFGHIAERLTLRPPETEFERGIRHFGYLLTQIMLLLVLGVFAINVFSHKPPVDALLFAIALAVGLSPELLPAIMSITLSKGAQQMATEGVIVRRLNAIENLGSMNVLCTDKTGTLTVGVVRLDGALDIHGQPSERVLEQAALNAQLQTGLSNPLDAAIIAEAQRVGKDTPLARKIDEIPYDWVRKRLSVVVEDGPHAARIITKGALANVLAVCDFVQDGATTQPLDDTRRQTIDQQFQAWSAHGYRVLGIAHKQVGIQARYSHEDEMALIFGGFLLFFDPPKPGVDQTVRDLTRLGVQLKIITGDNGAVAAHLAEAIGLSVSGMLTGAELNTLHDEALWQRASQTTLFVEVDPNQKERIIRALQKMGHVVGYLGDGINDAPALHAADVGISVDTAVDVAKDAADLVLLEHNLDVLHAGIQGGRTTFANTLKYIFTTTSANFGNMLSMAGASLFLPFLPLLAKQILLNNFLSDVPGMTIAGDNVDHELIDTPHRWDLPFIRSFMIVFGLLSSVFDYLTFGLLWLVVRAAPTEFRTAWFIESLLTELVVALVVRTRRPCWRSRPGRMLWISTLVVALLTIAFPYLPGSNLLGFTPLPPSIMIMLLAITALYVAGAEAAKRWFYTRWV